jgi:hypothetical protein
MSGTGESSDAERGHGGVPVDQVWSGEPSGCVPQSRCVSTSRCLRTRLRVAAASAAPTKGASTYTHRKSKRPEARAGPNWRVGVASRDSARPAEDQPCEEKSDAHTDDQQTQADLRNRLGERRRSHHPADDRRHAEEQQERQEELQRAVGCDRARIGRLRQAAAACSGSMVSAYASPSP